MSERPWIFTGNTFESQTRESSKRMYLLAADHRAKLQNQMADPEIAAMLTELDTAYPAFVQARMLWQVASGTYKGKTQMFEEKMKDLLRVQLPKWEGRVFNEYPEGTGTATEIFPDKRRPFYEGTYEDRVNAVSALANKLLEYPALAATQTEVAAFSTDMHALRDLQQNKEGAATAAASTMEEKRILLAVTMYGILGLLMHKYKENRHRINDFYDLTLLRDTGKEPALIEGEVGAGKVENIDVSDLNISAGTEITIRNTSQSGSILRFYFALLPTDTPGVVQQIVPPDTLVKVTAAELGYGTFNYFNVYNDTLEDGTWEVSL